MAILVRDKTNDRKYVLLGTGFGAFQAAKPHWFFGDWAQESSSGELALLAVADETGRIGWLASEDVEIVSVDGRSPAAWLA